MPGRQIHDCTKCRLAGESQGSSDVRIDGDTITSVESHSASAQDSNKIHLSGNDAIILPSLCHPHIHLDKTFLLAHPKYSHLQIEEGTFDEAMQITNKAKASFTEDDLKERGKRLIDDSIAAGVTHMRAFVEVDPIVDLKCLSAGLSLKQEYAERCHIQLCAFAQLPLFSGEDSGESTRRLMTRAAQKEWMADAVGSTPYVESDRQKMEQNVEWTVDLALENDKHLDFHLDYSLDPDTPPLIWHVMKVLKEKQWTAKSKRTIVLGHCTRLTLFTDEEWKRLKTEIGDLPISFVGLPTSDLYMMKNEHRSRGTLNIPRLIKEYGLNAAIGLNNIGNAFTPNGCCDPLFLANLGVGVYQAGTTRDAEILYECVSTRARAAIGLGTIEGQESSLQIRPGQPANLLSFGEQPGIFGVKQSITDVVYFYDGPQGRQATYNGRIITQ